jgi:hypothetical protein
MTKGWLNDDFDVPGDITAGGIENTPIGDTTPSTGEFTQIINSEIRLVPNYIENVGIFLSGGVITLKGSDGTSWSASNPGYVCGQSIASPGELILHTLTSDVTLTDSDLDSNLLGFPTGIALDFDVELSIKLVANDSDATPLFFVTRDHQATVSPLAANIGASDDKVADAINDFFCFTTLTESSYASNPATQIGKIRGKMNASDQWDFQTLSGEKDGVGIKFPKNLDWELINIATASASSTLDFDLPEDYDEYMFRIEALQPSVDGAQFLAKFHEGGSGGTVVSDYGRSGYQSISTGLTNAYSGFQGAMVIGDSVGNVISEALSGDILVYGCNGVSVRGKALINTFNNDTGFKVTQSRNYNYIGGASDSYDYITFYVSSGTITTGKIALFGRKYYTA